VSECDREASIIRRPWPTGGCCAMELQLGIDRRSITGLSGWMLCYQQLYSANRSLLPAKTYSPSPSLTSARCGDQSHATAALTPDRRPSTHCTRGWVRPRAGLGGCGESRHHRDSISRSSSLKRVAILNELPRPLVAY
jgi:hypothetical protein